MLRLLVRLYDCQEGQGESACGGQGALTAGAFSRLPLSLQ